jgi:prepilin-type N-terminal cleavage/methylation domain-containing protein
MRTGFSLVELVITVAIVGVLAAIAIPTFIDLQLRARKAEVSPVLRGIGVAEMAYYTSTGSWLEAAANPTGTPSKVPREWLLGQPGWTELGYNPAGELRCTYSISVDPGGDPALGTAECDIDGNGEVAVTVYTVPTAKEPGYFEELNPDWY